MMAGAFHRRRSGSARVTGGIALLEFLIVLPVLIVLMMAAAELGRAFYQYNTLTKAVRDGARYLAGEALGGSTGTLQLDAATVNNTRNLVVYGNTLGTSTPLLPGLTPAAITVTTVAPASVSVVANYPYPPIFARLPRFGSGASGPSGFTLRAGITMRAI
jgi:Flp pilus assembly protein TadG